MSGTLDQLLVSGNQKRPVDGKGGSDFAAEVADNWESVGIDSQRYSWEDGESGEEQVQLDAQENARGKDVQDKHEKRHSRGALEH